MADEVELTELDRLLRQELSVEPSPDFLPRVRARVDRERDVHTAAVTNGPLGWLRFPRWQLAAGVAVLMLAASGLLLVRTSETALPRTTTDVATGTATAAAPSTPARPPDFTPSAPTLVAERRPQITPKRAANHSAPAAGLDVEVIVDSRQGAAIWRVMEMVNTGQLTEASFVASRPLEIPVIEDVTTTAIAVDALAVSPVVAGGVLHKGTERN